MTKYSAKDSDSGESSESSESSDDELPRDSAAELPTVNLELLQHMQSRFSYMNTLSDQPNALNKQAHLIRNTYEHEKHVLTSMAQIRGLQTKTTENIDLQNDATKLQKMTAKCNTYLFTYYNTPQKQMEALRRSRDDFICYQVVPSYTSDEIGALQSAIDSNTTIGGGAVRLIKSMLSSKPSSDMWDENYRKQQLCDHLTNMIESANNETLRMPYSDLQVLLDRNKDLLHDEVKTNSAWITFCIHFEEEHKKMVEEIITRYEKESPYNTCAFNVVCSQLQMAERKRCLVLNTSDACPNPNDSRVLRHRLQATIEQCTQFSFLEEPQWSLQFIIDILAQLPTEMVTDRTVFNYDVRQLESYEHISETTRRRKMPNTIIEWLDIVNLNPKLQMKKHLATCKEVSKFCKNVNAAMQQEIKVARECLSANSAQARLHVLQKSCFVLCNAAFIDSDTVITTFCDRWDAACQHFNGRDELFPNNSILKNISAGWTNCNQFPLLFINPETRPIVINANDEYDYKLIQKVITHAQLQLYGNAARDNNLLVVHKHKVLQQEAKEQCYCDFLIADSMINVDGSVTQSALLNYFKTLITLHGLVWVDIYMAVVNKTSALYENFKDINFSDIAAKLKTQVGILFRQTPILLDKSVEAYAVAVFSTLQKMCSDAKHVLQVMNDILLVEQLYSGKVRETPLKVPLYHTATILDSTIVLSTTECACFDVQLMLSTLTSFAQESIEHIVAIKETLEYTQRFVPLKSVVPCSLLIHKCINALQQRKFSVTVLADNKWSTLNRIYTSEDKLLIPLDACAHLLCMCVAGQQWDWVVTLHCLLIKNIKKQMNTDVFFTTAEEKHLKSCNHAFWQIQSNWDNLTKPLLECKAFLANRARLPIVSYPDRIKILHAIIAATSTLHTYKNVWLDTPTRRTRNHMETIIESATLFCTDLTHNDQDAEIKEVSFGKGGILVPNDKELPLVKTEPAAAIVNTKSSLSIAIHTTKVDQFVEDLNTTLCNNVWELAFEPFKLSEKVHVYDCREHEKQNHDIHKDIYDEHVRDAELWRMLHCMFGTRKEQLDRVISQLKQSPLKFKDLNIQTKIELKLKIEKGYPSAAKVIKEVLQTHQHVHNLSIADQNQLIVQFEFTDVQERAAKPMFELHLQSALLECMSHLPTPTQLWSNSKYQLAVAKLLSCFDNARTFASASNTGIVNTPGSANSPAPPAYHMLTHFQTIYKRLNSYKNQLQNKQRGFNKGYALELRKLTKTVLTLKNVTENYAEKLQQFETNIHVYNDRKRATQHELEGNQYNLSLDQVVDLVKGLAFVRAVNRSTIVYYPSEQNNVLLDMHDSKSLMLNLHRQCLNNTRNACKHWVTCPDCHQLRLLQSAFILYDSPFSHNSPEYAEDKQKIIKAYKQTSVNVATTSAKTCQGCNMGVLRVKIPPSVPIDDITDVQSDWLLAGKMNRMQLVYTRVTPLTPNDVVKFLTNTLTSIPISENTIQTVMQHNTTDGSFMLNEETFDTIEEWIAKYCTQQFECNMADVTTDTKSIENVKHIAALLATGNVGSGGNTQSEFTGSVDNEIDAIRQELLQVEEQYKQKQMLADKDTTDVRASSEAHTLLTKTEILKKQYRAAQNETQFTPPPETFLDVFKGLDCHTIINGMQPNLSVATRANLITYYQRNWNSMTPDVKTIFQHIIVTAALIDDINAQAATFSLERIQMFECYCSMLQIDDFKSIETEYEELGNITELTGINIEEPEELEDLKQVATKYFHHAMLKHLTCVYIEHHTANVTGNNLIVRAATAMSSPDTTQISEQFKLFYAAITEAKQLSRPSDGPLLSDDVRVIETDNELSDEKVATALSKASVPATAGPAAAARSRRRSVRPINTRQLVSMFAQPSVSKTVRVRPKAQPCLASLNVAEKRVQESLDNYKKGRDTARNTDIANTAEKMNKQLYKQYASQYNALDIIMTYCTQIKSSDHLGLSCKQWYTIRANNLTHLNTCYESTDPETCANMKKWVRIAQTETFEFDLSNIDIPAVKANVKQHQFNMASKMTHENKDVFEAAVDFVTSDTVFYGYQLAHRTVNKQNEDTTNTILRLAVAIGLQSEDVNKFADIAFAVFQSDNEEIAQNVRETLARATAMLVSNQFKPDYEYLFSNPSQYVFAHADDDGTDLVTKVILQPQVQTNNNMFELNTEVGFGMCCESHLTAKQRLFEYERDQNINVVVSKDEHRVFELNDMVTYESTEWTIVEVYYTYEWVKNTNKDFVTIQQNQTRRKMFRDEWHFIDHKLDFVCNLYNNTISVRITKNHVASASFEDNLFTACNSYLTSHTVENRTNCLNHTVAYTELRKSTITDVATDVTSDVHLQPAFYNSLQYQQTWRTKFKQHGSNYLARVLEWRRMTEFEEYQLPYSHSALEPLTLSYRETDLNAIIHQPTHGCHVLQFKRKYSWTTKKKHSYIILNEGVASASRMYDMRMTIIHQQHKAKLDKANAMLKKAFKIIPQYLPFANEASAQYEHVQLNCGSAFAITMLKGDNVSESNALEIIKRIKQIITALLNAKLWYTDLKPANLITVGGTLNLIDLDALVSNPMLCDLACTYQIYNKTPSDQWTDSAAVQSYYTYLTLMHSYVCCLQLVATATAAEHIWTAIDKTTYDSHIRTENMLVFDKMTRVQAEHLLDSYDDKVFLLRRLYTVTASAFCTRYQKAVYRQLGEDYNNASINFFVLSYKTGNCYEHIECLQILNDDDTHTPDSSAAEVRDLLDTANHKLLDPSLSSPEYLAVFKEKERLEIALSEIPITGLNHYVYWRVNRADINNFGKDGKDTLTAFAEYLQTTLERRPIINHAASGSKMSALLTLANVVTSDKEQRVELQKWFNSIELAADTILNNKYPHAVCL